MWGESGNKSQKHKSGPLLAAFVIVLPLKTHFPAASAHVRAAPQEKEEKGRKKRRKFADKPGSVGRHRDGTGQSFLLVTCCHATPAAYPGATRATPMLPYLALPRMGFAVPVLLPVLRWALTPPFHPCLCLAAIGGLLSVALSVASRRPAVNRHPALRGPDFPLRARGAQRLPGELPVVIIRASSHLPHARQWPRWRAAAPPYRPRRRDSSPAPSRFRRPARHARCWRAGGRRPDR